MSPAARRKILNACPYVRAARSAVASYTGHLKASPESKVAAFQLKQAKEYLAACESDALRSSTR